MNRWRSAAGLWAAALALTAPGCSGGSTGPSGADPSVASPPPTASTTSSPTSTSTTSTSTTTTSTTSTTTTLPNFGGPNLGDGPGGSTIPAGLPVPGGSTPAPPLLPSAPAPGASSTSTVVPVSTSTTVPAPSIPEAARATAERLYRALVIGDEATIRTLASVGPVRTNVGGEGTDPLARWRADPAGDLTVVLLRLLETTPALDGDGNVVWPGLAVKAPDTWDPRDEADLARLGFPPNVVAAVMSKRRYLDRRIVITPRGVWREFRIGL